MPIWKSVFVTAVALSSAFALAQKADDFDLHCSDILMLQAKDIQADLKITAAQRNQMNVFADAHRKKLADLKVKAEQTRSDVRPELAKYYEELKGNVLGQLSAAQIKRLREITLQRVGLAALRDPVVQKRVGMSTAQGTKFDAIFKEGADKFTTTEKAAIEPILKPYEGKTAKTKEEAERWNKDVQTKLAATKTKIAPQLASIRATYDARLRGVLTSEQNKAYKALMGVTFKPAPSQPAPGK